ncbi:hypothetical protein [Fodinicola feengrottensis]|uniref:hypothetical protein n=1 Tax=Fodinicola feengrottensis TaxID=435914 RepID=UPI0024424598|nr:hypothetical protein [Fodinicola feengrottensis]
MSRRLARWVGGRAVAEAPAVAAEPLIAAHRRHFPKADVDVLRRGFEVAAFAHRDQKRKSGAPYVTHPLRSHCCWPSSAWTPRRWWRRCCTTPSRTLPLASTR